MPELVFMPDDPPRAGRFALYLPPGDHGPPGCAGRYAAFVNLVLPSGASVRRKAVPARFLTVAEGISYVLTGGGTNGTEAEAGRDYGTGGGANGTEAEDSAEAGMGGSSSIASPTLEAWRTAVAAGLTLLARGRLVPAITASGFDTWRVGPLDSADLRLLEEIAAGFPPAAHCVPVGTGSPTRVQSPSGAVRAAWDAIADAMVRTPAAEVVGGGALFTAVEPQSARDVDEWLAETSRGLDSGVRVGLRIALDGMGATGTGDAMEAARDDDRDEDGMEAARDDDRDEDGMEAARDDDRDEDAMEAERDDDRDEDAMEAERDDDRDEDGYRDEVLKAQVGPVGVVQATALADPSLVVDAADLFTMPAAVLSRFGADAESDLLLSLRRDARAWPQLAPLLRQRVPGSLPLTESDIDDLLGNGADALAAAGIDVLWPSSLLSNGISLRMSVTSAPESTGMSGFSLEEMVTFRWQAVMGGETLSEEELNALADTKRSLVRIRGRWVAVDPEIVARLREKRVCEMTTAQALAAVMAGTMDVDGESVGVVAEGSIATFAARLSEMGDSGAPLLGAPPGFMGELRPYQERGVSWMYQMCDLGMGGCLADDMGLGKTIQVIGLHLHRAEIDPAVGKAIARPPKNARPATVASKNARPATVASKKAAPTTLALEKTSSKKTSSKKVALKKTGPKRAAPPPGTTLIVCPTSLLGNWVREIGRFAPHVPARRYHGPERTLSGLKPGEVVVTTYGVARRDRSELREAGFSLVVADEAQHAKNPFSETARALRVIGGRANGSAGVVPSRIALTGTPVENRLTELWSILDWTTPGLLGPLESFRRSVATSIEQRRDPEVLERLTRAVRPFLLRRKKTDPQIAPDLPARMVTDRPVPLTPEQVTLYEAEVREALDTIHNKKGIQRQGLVFRMLTVLKQICNHPAQYLHQPGPIAGRSGKLAALEELLEVILAEGESVLVFSQYVDMCTIIQSRLSELGVDTLFLHGGTSAKRRDEMVTAFQAGHSPVFLLSLKAGGVGLNLTAATHVVHFDRWWNPAVEDQATDRAHRIGQDRPVQVHRLIVEGTLEDRIATLLEKKRDLADAVVGEGEAWITQLSDDELAELVKLGTP